MRQTIIKGERSYYNLAKILNKHQINNFLLVCDSAYQFLPIKQYINKLNINYVVFDQFTSNPLYEDVCKGVDLFNQNQCDAIVAVGGGSAIDTAKCIKLFCSMDTNSNYLNQAFEDNNLLFIAIPTTAGTGSESTKYSVIYYKGEKQSITHESLIPLYAILDHSLLRTLPIYQKKCTMLDALCQGIESFWSINSNFKSRKYSARAIKLILKYIDPYLANSQDGLKKIMLAANYSGRAINITQTTAPHAMSYKLTSLFQLPHGHAVAVCLPKVWRFMNDNLEKSVHPKGNHYLLKLFKKLAKLFGVNTIDQAIIQFEKLLISLDINAPKNKDYETIELLTNSVNITRLKNNPVKLSQDDLKYLYEKILS